MLPNSNNNYNKKLKPLARALRKEMTTGEKRLWYSVLCKSQMMNYRFLRQRAIDNYIADFFCKELKLLIEVDGSYHNLQVEKDEKRDARLKELGYETLRISNSMVMKDIENVIRSIEAKILERENELGVSLQENEKSPL